MRSTLALAILFAAVNADGHEGGEAAPVVTTTADEGGEGEGEVVAPDGNTKANWIPVDLVSDDTWKLMTYLYNEGSTVDGVETPELHGELRMSKVNANPIKLEDEEKNPRKLISFGWMAALQED